MLSCLAGFVIVKFAFLLFIYVGYATNFQSNYPMYNSPSYSHPPQGVGYPNSYGFGIQGQNYGYGSSGYESSGSEQRSDSYGMQRGYQQYAGNEMNTISSFTCMIGVLRLVAVLCLT